MTTEKQPGRIEYVKVSDVRPNPNRKFSVYAIQRTKVDRLIESINETGFWENVIGRRMEDGTVQIAYGHHRLVAAKEVYKDEGTIPIIIRDLSDDMMRKIMIRENAEEYGCHPAAIDDAVQASRDYFNKHLDEAKAVLATVRPDVKRVRVGPPLIAADTGYPEFTVELSLKRLEWTESGKIDAEALYKMPYQEAARRFAQQVLENRESEPLTFEQQKFLADHIVEKGQFGAGSINLVFMEYRSVGKPSTNPNHPNFYEMKLRNATKLGYALIKTLKPFSQLNIYKVRMFEEMPTKEDISEQAKEEFLLMLPNLAEAVALVGKKLDQEPAPFVGTSFILGERDEPAREE